VGTLTRGQKNIRWIETYCRIPEGTFVGQPVRLRAWQKREIRKIYDNPAGTRTAILSFARKNAKTTLSAFLLLLHLVGPEAEVNSQLLSTAQSRDQAAVIFELAAKIVRMSPSLYATVGIRDSSKQLYCDELGTEYKALSAEAKTAFGKSPVFVVHDELGQVAGSRSLLFESVETAAGAHDNPMSIIISTQAPTDADLLSILIDDALAGHDPRIVVSLYTAPDTDDPFKVKTIRKANPAYGDFLNANEVKKQAGEARRMPSREVAYRNLVLNQRINVVSPFIAPAVWKACGNDVLEAAFESGPVRAGLDLSSRHDLTALVYEAELDGVHHVRAEFFVPLDGISDRSMRDRAPYDLWHQQGFITATPGASVDYAVVARRLIDLCDKYDVSGIAFDRWRIDVLKAELLKMGVELPLIPHGQGFKDMSPALDTLEGELLSGRVRHGNNPVLTMCASNSIVDTDPAGNRKLNKAKSTGRIDGMVSLAMCMNHPQAEVVEYASGRLVAL
jgi:phage terminase large subunit-like protein